MEMGSILPLLSVSLIARTVPSVAVTLTATSFNGNLALLVKALT
jgi:hypothetical protein